MHASGQSRPLVGSTQVRDKVMMLASGKADSKETGVNAMPRGGA